MCMWTAKEKSLNYDQAKADAAKAQKDIKMVRSWCENKSIAGVFNLPDCWIAKNQTKYFGQSQVSSDFQMSQL